MPTESRADLQMIERIQSIVASDYGVTVEILLSARRNPVLDAARRVSLYLAHQVTALSWQRIGDQFQGRDRTTVRDAALKCDAAIRTNKVLAARVAALRARVCVGANHD